MKNLLIIVLLFTGIAYAQPPINNPTPYEVCDTDQNGMYSFDLLSKNAEILGSLSTTEYVLTYHETQADAQLGVYPINASFPYLNIIPNSQTLWVRVEEIATPSNFVITTLQLVINNAPTVPASVSDLIVYENPNDGSAVFDLTSKDNEINDSPSFVISFYNSLSDAQNDTNPIPNGSTFLGSHLQTIYARVLNPVTACTNFTSFILKVFDSNLVVYIPDSNFRNKLLSANAGNTIAKDLSGNFTSVDTNSNGEIEFTEALNISYLDVNQSNIADMTGISSFTNLTYLDCRLNLVLNNLDVSSLSNLTYLNAYYAGLISLTLTPTIVNLDISANSLSGSLDLTTFTNLQTFKSGPYNGLTSLNLSGLTNLTTVDCSINSLNYLNITGCTQLTHLNCSQNNLPDLNVNGLTALSTLYCSENQLSTLNATSLSNLTLLSCANNNLNTLNVNNLSNLLTLVCTSNNLISLDLSGLINLNWLACENNDLTLLNLESLNNIANLFCGNNQLSFIDISMLSNLQIFHCTENQIVTINATGLTNLININCASNPLLTSIFMKGTAVTGNNPSYFGIGLNPNLEYICANESAFSSIQDLINAFGYTNCVLNSYCSFTPEGNYNTITGNISYDFNDNGCDANDIIQPNVRININDGTMQGATFTDANGNYTFYTQAGTFDLSPSIDNSAIFAISPATSTIAFADNNNNTVSQNFCVTGVGVNPDVEIVIVPIDPARPGFDAKYDIVIKNKGNQILSGDINFNFDDALLDFISATEIPTLQNDGLLSWSYVNLLPFENRSIEVILNVNSPMETPAVNNGDVLTFTANVSPIATDITPADNSFIFSQTVVGSYDPNDITCLEGDVVSPSEIGNYLHYVVNFENTGTFMAENIVVKTVLNPAELDVNSLQLLNTSHTSYVRIVDNTVEFVFENVNLEAKSGNPPVGGHGNVLFRIRSNDELNTNDFVTNAAKIYFDYNFPIETNVAQTTFEALNNSVFNLDESVSVSPNPTNGNININSRFNIKSIELYDVQGRILETVIGNKNVIDISDKTNGIYFLKINTENGSKVEKIVKE